MGKNLPNTLYDLYKFIMFVSVINLFVNLTINGLFYGNYKTIIK